jgi:uncharacterized protein (DUF1501 family)
MKRRNFLKSAAALGGVSLFSLRDAQAADSGYKALIYVYMTGGNDGFNCFVPLDEAIYRVYNQTRAGLAIRRSAADSGAGGDNGYLLPLQGDEAVGMHPCLAPLQQFWNDKSMAIVTNVGPLVRPIRKAEYAELVRDGDTSQIPGQLFDHGGQQNCWHNAMGDPKVQSGWAGRALEAAGMGASYSFAGDKRWGQAQRVVQLRLSGTALKYNDNMIVQPRVASTARIDLIKSLVDSATRSDADLVRAWGAQELDTIIVSETIGPLLAGQPVAAIGDGFAGTRDVEFVRHLKRAAAIVGARAQLNGVRDIICVGTGDFDTHANQLGRHPVLLRDLAEAVAGFTKAMRNMGLGNQVSCMTASDFGRSLKPNSSDGTDHAWGNCHFVIGGAVEGQKVYGKWPDYSVGGPDDKGSGPSAKGTLIPTLSVNQYAATVLKWFLPQIDPAQTLPDLRNFQQHDLGFMKPG